MVRTVEATRRMERNGRSRHIPCGVPCKAPQPPESPRERYGLGDALTGAIHSSGSITNESSAQTVVVNSLCRCLRSRRNRRLVVPFYRLAQHE
jgi:hypothetical protein